MIKNNRIKVGLIIALAVMTTYSADARLYNGYAIGANAGFLVDQNRPGRTGVDGLFFKFHGKNKTLGYLGIQGDFEMSRPNDLYGALSLSFTFPTGSSGHKKTSFINVNKVMTNGNTLNDITGTYRVKQEFNGDFTFAAGYNFCGNQVLYVLAGVRYSSKKHKFTFVETVTDTTPTTTTTTYVVGKKQQAMPVFGAGFKTRLGQKVTVGIDYKYSYAHHVKYKISAPVIKGRINTQDQSVVARMSYHFFSL